ncbi:MAG: hypothetical protein ACMXYE_03155 [Candidatus Woesearchaeota archaeon]
MVKLTLNEIQKAIENSWSKETAYFDFLWCKNNNSKSSGQCQVTALLVQELLGGDILYSHVVGNEDFDHYWNKIGEVEIDLTSKQFRKETKFVKPTILSREKIIKNDKRVLETYKILKENYLKNISKQKKKEGLFS